MKYYWLANIDSPPLNIISNNVAYWDAIIGLHFPIFACQGHEKESLNVVDTCEP